MIELLGNLWPILATLVGIAVVAVTGYRSGSNAERVRAMKREEQNRGEVRRVRDKVDKMDDDAVADALARDWMRKPPDK